MKTYLLLLLGAIGCTPVFSQQWRIAPVLGVNLASVSVSDAYKADLNSGTVKTDLGIAFKWQIGAFADYAFTDRFAFRTGLFYTPKGFNLTVTSSQASAYPIKGSLSSYYLEVPLLANVAVGQKGFRLVGGPVVGVALGGQSTLDPVQYQGSTLYSGGTTNLTVGSGLRDGLLPTETSLTIGLIRERDRLGLPVELGVYTQIGLSNWNPGFSNRSNYSIRNGLFGLKIAYFFEVGR